MRAGRRGVALEGHAWSARGLLSAHFPCSERSFCGREVSGDGPMAVCPKRCCYKPVGTLPARVLSDCVEWKQAGRMSR